MITKLIMLVSFFMCSVPFLIISSYNKNDSLTPIPFWSGSENKLKNKLKNIEKYNEEMAAVYKKCAAAFGIAAISSLIHPLIGIIVLAFNCTIGIYIVFKKYKTILEKYSI